MCLVVVWWSHSRMSHPLPYGAKLQSSRVTAHQTCIPHDILTFQTIEVGSWVVRTFFHASCFMLVYYSDPTPLSRIGSRVAVDNFPFPTTRSDACRPPATRPFRPSMLRCFPGDVTVLQLDAEQNKSKQNNYLPPLAPPCNAMLSILPFRIASSSCYPADLDQLRPHPNMDAPQQHEARRCQRIANRPSHLL
jgi:hypothetical protein